MKASQRDFAGLAPRAAKSARVFFFCGPDEAGAGDAAARIAALLPDAGERIEMAGADLRKDPTRLGDEARSNSLFGEARHIWVRAHGDEAHDAVAILIEGLVEPCPVLIVATGATDKSRTARLLADRADSLVAMFYAADLGGVAGSVRAMADAAGLRVDDAIAERLARAANLDTRLARAEVTKLALYLDADPRRPVSADMAALDAITASTPDDDFAPLVDAALGGATARLGPELARMRALGLSPVGLLLACERRAAQLAALAGKLDPRGDIGALLKAETDARRVFWSQRAALGDQLRRWRGPTLERLIARLIALHGQMLSDSRNAELLLAQGLTEITRVAARRG